MKGIYDFHATLRNVADKEDKLKLLKVWLQDVKSKERKAEVMAQVSTTASLAVSLLMEKGEQLQLGFHGKIGGFELGDGTGIDTLKARYSEYHVRLVQAWDELDPEDIIKP